jgi:hypothetical protein
MENTDLAALDRQLDAMILAAWRSAGGCAG